MRVCLLTNPQIHIEGIFAIRWTDYLLTYPYIEDKYNKNEVNIVGWYYAIETGEVFAFNLYKEEFILLN